MRHIVALFCFFIFCAQCVVHAAPTLAVVYSEKFGLPLESIEFSQDGKTLVAHGDQYAGLYRASDYTLLDERRRIPDKERILILGAGYLDAQTWYFVEDDMMKKDDTGVSAHIRSISSAREIARHPFGGGENRPVAANGSHIAFSDKLLDWKTGQIYRTKIAHFTAPGLTLTKDGNVVTYSDSQILIDDPLRREIRGWDTGSAIVQFAMIPGGKVITVSEKGACQMWAMPPPSEKSRKLREGEFFRHAENPTTADGFAKWRTIGSLS